MRRFIEGADRRQIALFPECLEDWICEDNPVRVIDVFVDELDLVELKFEAVVPRGPEVGFIALQRAQRVSRVPFASRYRRATRQAVAHVSC